MSTNILKQQRLIQVQSHPNGPRLYVGPWRLHHGMTGMWLVAWGATHHGAAAAAACVAGLAMIAHDAHDAPWPLRDPRPATPALTAPGALPVAA